MPATTVSDPAPPPLRGWPALLDALRYPLRAPAWILNAVYLFGRILAFLLPIYGTLVHLALTLGVYKYAFECLASSARGRRTPPEALAHADSGTHRRHLLLQLWWLIVLVLISHFLDLRTAVLVGGALSLALPGALIALCVAQNLAAALNPVSWWTVATRLGVGYAFLSAAAFAVLMLQVAGRHWLQDSAWPLLSLVLFYALSQHLILALFRALGNALHAHADVLGFETTHEALPVIERDRERAAQAGERDAALKIADPAARVEALATQLRDANDHALHDEYRRLLRQLGRHAALAAHARVHLCELLALGRTAAALALASEALGDDRAFTLPDAESVLALLDAGERSGLARQVAQIAENYGHAHPRRFDGLEPARRAARLCADVLREPQRARALLERGADGPEAAEFTRLRQRLDAGLPLRALLASDPSTSRR